MSPEAFRFSQEIMDTPNGSNTNVLKKTPQEEKADISAKIKELAKDPSKNAKELATLAIRNVKLERELEGKGEEIPEEEIKELSEQTLDDLQKQPKEQVKETVKKSVTKELAEKEKKRAEE